MPLYSYKCENCKEEFDQRNTIAGRDQARCECGAVAQRSPSLVTAIFRGKGFTKHSTVPGASKGEYKPTI